MKLTAEEQTISERFLELPVVPLDSYLTDDKVRRSRLYILNEIERASLTERQATEIVARAADDDMVIDRKVSFDVTDLNAPVRNATGPPSRKRKVVRPVSQSKWLFLSFDRVSKKK